MTLLSTSSTAPLKRGFDASFHTPLTAASPAHMPASAPAAVSGCFKLRGAHAITLAPRVRSVLKIAHGGAWVTRSDDLGDHFLVAGDGIAVHAGETLVIEAWSRRNAAAATGVAAAPGPVYFSFDPAPLTQAVHAAAPTRASWLRSSALRGTALPSKGWEPLQGLAVGLAAGRGALGQALADLRAAALLGAGALARLVAVLLLILPLAVVTFAINLVAACARICWDFGCFVVDFLANGVARFAVGASPDLLRDVAGAAGGDARPATRAATATPVRRAAGLAAECARAFKAQPSASAAHGRMASCDSIASSGAL